jgi:hypothetical protein
VRDIGVKPAIGNEDEFIGIWIQPCSPPGEAAVRHDVATARRHEPEIFMRVGLAVVIDEDIPRTCRKLLAAESDVVGEDKECRIRSVLAHRLDGVLIVGDGQGVPTTVDGGVVAAANVERDRGFGPAYLKQRLEIFSCRSITKRKLVS